MNFSLHRYTSLLSLVCFFGTRTSLFQPRCHKRHQQNSRGPQIHITNSIPNTALCAAIDKKVCLRDLSRSFTKLFPVPGPLAAEVTELFERGKARGGGAHQYQYIGATTTDFLFNRPTQQAQQQCTHTYTSFIDGRTDGRALIPPLLYPCSFETQARGHRSAIVPYSPS